MTIFVENTKVGRIVPGKLDCKTASNNDLYGKSSDDYNEAYRLYDEAGNIQRAERKAHILATFRKLVAEHKLSFPNEAVVKCYMNYRDAEFLYQAYRAELALTDDIIRGCDDDFVCDKIQVKKGCDTDSGKITIHSVVVANDENTKTT